MAATLCMVGLFISCLTDQGTKCMKRVSEHITMLTNAYVDTDGHNDKAVIEILGMSKRKIC